jgi:N utilization substance protein B
VAGTRRRGREAALQILYQMDTTGVAATQAAGLFWEHLMPGDGGLDEDGQAFANELVLGIGRESEKVDAAIKSASEHWRIERMPRVDRNILRVATYEILFLPDVPRRVTINEAIELAKRYGDAGSPAFVNGVLDRIAQDAGKD